MAKTPIWKSIAATLSNEIAAGHYSPGDKLPTEAQLASRFSVNRHTVRRALQDMQEQGLTQSRRGAGVFVMAEPTEYPIGRRVRFHQNIAAAGRSADKRLLSLQTRPCDSEEAEALDLTKGDPVHVYEGVSLADTVPIAVSRSVFPGARFPHLIEGLEQHASVTKALAAAGVRDYTRSVTRMTAVLATATQATQLNISEGAPILRTISVNVDLEGLPVEFGYTWWVGDRMTLVLED
ncbi:MAG: phosphonate metabolism transcriptional regulator PhnF [Pseudomonadota bacterium]|jgi:GntR family phosphonate transport system transcriptional regulator|uniref:COG2188 Transcriptional regulators n=1 Tax=uncultured bacterium B3TF_MPn2 TaxID=1439867 RepID=W0NUM5_9BACT|nr:COG2188 Transcriptional regulators [uncultured bacterium B3TF_MPn2]MEC7964627.1 phosphonate metabolism transcriptional regulator PhnF [Pseudomonadota bacterium]MEC8295290.1 phosphonate metabolism transcriptional regulator PhnF [Pseudomonadota bacterium]